MKINFLHYLLDSLKSVEPEVLRCYQNKMPDSVEVAIKKDDDKYYAEINGLDNDNVLFTQARSRAELEEMVNDAIATYYEIPYRYARLLLINKRYLDPTLRHKRQALRTA